MPDQVDPQQVSYIANAIAYAEGYGADGSNKPTRTNNPGDIGNTDDGSTKKYSTPDAGWSALEHQIGIIVDGRSRVYSPDDTLADVSKHYASDSTNWLNNVSKRLGVPPDTKLSDIATGKVKTNIVPRPGSPDGASSGVGQDPANVGTTNTGSGPEDGPTIVGSDSDNITDQLPLSDIAISQDVLDQLSPVVQIDEGLDEQPWFENPNLITGNPRLKAFAIPVSFQIFLGPLVGQFLSNPQTNEPISIRLNASLQTFSKAMSHVYTKEPSRTGMHITFWGQKPDLITGSGSTGVFMNQFGLTSFMSLSHFDGEAKAAILKMLQNQGRPSDNFDFNDFTGGDPGTALLQQSGFTDDALRVAAQDAFAELLALFRNNGVTYYMSDTWDGNFDKKTQSSPTAWSPSVGLSAIEKNARNNDVLTKGYVVFNFKESTYMGYFKSFSWEQDAEKPYSWHFNFAFQVERELTITPYLSN